MAFTMITWRDAVRTVDVLNQLTMRVTPDQGRYLAWQAIRICCPTVKVKEGEEWGFVDGTLFSALDGYYVSPRVPPGWTSKRAMLALRTQVANYARIAAGNAVWLYDTLWREGLPTPGQAEVTAMDQLRTVARDVFPEDPSLELGPEVTTNTAFPSMARAMLFGDVADKAVAADWLRDRGEDTAADHLLENTTGAQPWWLRPEVCTFDLTQT